MLNRRAKKLGFDGLWCASGIPYKYMNGFINPSNLSFCGQCVFCTNWP